jgi:hypothetical protein
MIEYSVFKDVLIGIIFYLNGAKIAVGDEKKIFYLSAFLKYRPN